MLTNTSWAQLMQFLRTMVTHVCIYRLLMDMSKISAGWGEGNTDRWRRRERISLQEVADLFDNELSLLFPRWFNKVLCQSFHVNCKAFFQPSNHRQSDHGVGTKREKFRSSFHQSDEIKLPNHWWTISCNINMPRYFSGPTTNREREEEPNVGCPRGKTIYRNFPSHHRNRRRQNVRFWPMENRHQRRCWRTAKLLTLFNQHRRVEEKY